jgi:hypothetical protein
MNEQKKFADNPDMIQIELIKLATGARLLRLTEPTSELAL